MHNVNFWILIGGNISVDWRILVISVNLFTVVIIGYRYMIIYVHWYNVDCPIFMGGNVRPLVKRWWSEIYIRNYIQYTYSVDHRILTGGNAFPLVQCWWFSPVSSTNITNCNDITEILLKMALNTITLTPIIPDVVGHLQIMYIYSKSNFHLWVTAWFFSKHYELYRVWQYTPYTQIIFFCTNGKRAWNQMLIYTSIRRELITK